MTCHLCHERKPKRFCPAEDRKICAVCCGTCREVSIDCPSTCPHLIAARRYDAEHRRPLPLADLPYPDLPLPVGLIRERQDVLALLGQAILAAAQESGATDADALDALAAIAETCRALHSGIYYEPAPPGQLARAIYTRLSTAIAEFKQAQTARLGPAINDGQLFELSVFLLRLGRQESSGRPRSRAFLDFLRSSLPTAPRPEPGRIITA